MSANGARGARSGNGLPGMKLPLRAAPPPPSQNYQSSWKDDLFSQDPFASSYETVEKKKPPPRPPPPKFNRAALSKPDVPSRPSHFNRKPTILSSLMTRRPKPSIPLPQTNIGDFQSHVILPSKSNPYNINSPTVASLIDFSSPPSSPTLTTRSSSDGLSIDSFGSDITSSTGNGNVNLNGGNSSQAESGFEDDFDLFSNKSSTTAIDNSEPWGGFDPFSPPKNKTSSITKPVYDSDFLDPLCNGKTVVPKVQTHKLPTIIRPKPARPKAPKNSVLLSTTLSGTEFSSSELKSVRNGILQKQNSSNDLENIFESGDYSPPMPTEPPPPPPALDNDDLLNDASSDSWMSGFDPVSAISNNHNIPEIDEEPYGIALYDFPGSHNDDLPFKANDKIRLLRQMNEEWFYGKHRCGMEGIFPANFIEIKVPLKAESAYVTALYEFVPQQEGDLGFTVGNKIKVTAQVSDQWLYGELGSNRGQFPANYVDHIPSGLPNRSL